MSGEQAVPPEKWAVNFRTAGLSDESSAWEVARAWISEGLVEWGNDTDDPEKILRDLVRELPQAHCPYDCDRCHDDYTEIEDGGCSCRNCRHDSDPPVTPCTCVNCEGI